MLTYSVLYIVYIIACIVCICITYMYSVHVYTMAYIMCKVYGLVIVYLQRMCFICIIVYTLYKDV